MVMMKAGCNLCNFKATKNGYVQIQSAMIDHARKDHPEEYKEKREKDIAIALHIRELRNSAIQLWSHE